MKIKYIGKTMKADGYTLMDGVTFKKKGQVIDVNLTEDDINSTVLYGLSPVLEIVAEIPEVVEVVEEVEVVSKGELFKAPKKRGYNKG